jgi:NitT/TauT family transport system permease protein
MAADTTIPASSIEPVANGGGLLEPRTDRERQGRKLASLRRAIGSGPIALARLAILVAILAAWQFLPEISSLRSVSPVFNPFFVSSPQRVWQELVDLAGGSHGVPSVWPYLWQTVKSTVLGLVIGVALGALVGLVLSNSRSARQVLSPFIVVMNATPRIALIPIFVIIAGPTTTASVLTAVAVVFFLVFYNAYSGGLGVPRETLDNARLLGASPIEVMRTVRLPYVLVWTFASLPNAISFGLVAVVTAELLTGQLGMGSLLESSISSVDATLTFAVVVILAAVGVIAVTAAEAIRKRALHWWEIGAE